MEILPGLARTGTEGWGRGGTRSHHVGKGTVADTSKEMGGCTLAGE